jgi:hypothetical protein
VADQAIDQRRRHDLVAEDLAALLAALVAGQDRRDALVAVG